MKISYRISSTLLCLVLLMTPAAPGILNTAAAADLSSDQIVIESFDSADIAIIGEDLAENEECGTSAAEFSDSQVYSESLPSDITAEAMEESDVSVAYSEFSQASEPDVTRAIPAAQFSAPSVAEQLLAAESTEEMYALVLTLMQNDSDALLSLSADEINALRSRIEELDPEGDDADTQDLIDTLAMLSDGGELVGDPGVLAEATISQSDSWKGDSSINEDTVWTFQDGVVITLKFPITIPAGKTLTLKGWGSFARYSTNTNALFIVNDGGKLIIEGLSEERPFTIDGYDVIANAPLINSSGELNFKNAVIRNGKNRSVNESGKPNGSGGGITITSTGSLTMDHCVVTRNTASSTGGGIQCNGTMSITNSTISYNRAASAETGPNVVNAGRGGGFNLTGTSATGTLRNVIIEGNAAMYYGGGGQIQSKASLTMEEDTIFSNNTAILHGAGALHVTADATFTMNGGKMENNTAQTVGGAIHSSYSCVLNLNAGQILNNTANGRGGGVHINTGGAITLGAGLTISGNRANNEATGSSADLDATGDNWSNVKNDGAHSNNGYGGGVLIDSGTCTVAGATITNNSAAVGGGGVALVMLNVSSSGGLDDILVVNFKMTGGTISENTTEGSGAGVYLMSNMLKENIIHYYGAEGTEGYKTAVNSLKFSSFLTDEPTAEISGGTVSNNAAIINGGGLYLGEKTKFILTAGSVSNNNAVDGAGVYVASGTAVIGGGEMSGNIASSEGGALYVSGTVSMTAGEITDNSATVNGGALYITGGNFTMSDGKISNNTAIQNGGAAYITGGDVTIKHGTLNSNKAVQGGAIYMGGNDDALLILESGTMNYNEATDDGGAIYATGGTIEIGLKDCREEDADELQACTHHTAEGVGRHHPEIESNKAADTGGGIAIANEGVVHFYCGEAKDNQALYKGVGMNIFMNGGDFYLYDGANIGIPRDPDLVIVGGELHNECENTRYIKLYYYSKNTETDTKMVGMAEYGEFMSLPDGEYFWDAPKGYVFLGWTAQGAASGTASNEFVRNKEHYVASGAPVQVLDHQPQDTTDATGKNTERIFDGNMDDAIHLYALWAPGVSRIHYMDEDGSILHEPDTYEFSYGTNVIEILPIKKHGLDLIGWYIYQNDDQNANWNVTLDDVTYERNSKTFIKLASRNATLSLEAGYTNFGDITLIPVYVSAYTTLTITKTNCCENIDKNQTFLFIVTGGDGVELTVTVHGNNSVTIEGLTVGQTYTITEKTDWSWRYDYKSVALTNATLIKEVTDGATITIGVDGTITFVNERIVDQWLDGDSWCDNRFIYYNSKRRQVNVQEFN